MRAYSETNEVGPLPGTQDNSFTDVPTRVLIIDDDPVDREIFKDYLEADQPGAYTYVEAETGLDGIRKLDSFHPDCVILDFHLPDLDGLKMIRLLREGRKTLPCAVVMMTGIGSEKIAVEAMKLGVMDYLAKGPANSMALSRTVAGAIQRFRLQLEVAEQRVALEQRNRELEAIRAELFEEKERYRVLAEAIPQLVWTADSNGSIHYGNRRLWEFTGKSNTRPLPIENLVHSDDRPVLTEKWSEAVRSIGAFECELRLQRAHDQSWRWHLMRTAPIRPSEGGPVRFFGTFTDVEEQKRAQEASRQREKLDSIGLLAGGIAHDFNNLLVGIMGGASFALDSLEKAHSAYPMLEIILRSSERAATLTQQLLAYAGKVQIFLEPSDISRVARDSCEQVLPSIPANIEFKLEPCRDVPLLPMNVGQMQQVIVNLVMNAVEAIGEEYGEITVKTGVERILWQSAEADGFQARKIPATVAEPNVLGYELPPGLYAVLEVSDSGPGMEEHVRSHIFDPFFTTKFTGRGLGLAAVQGIIRSLRGGIQVISSAGEGSTFRLLLPAPNSDAS